MFLGKRLEYDDPKFTKFVNDLNKTIEVASAMGLLGFVPWLVKVLPGKLLGADIVLGTINNFNGYAAV